MPPRRWDLFCRVIDNFGDVGVAWRLAAALAAQGQAVRLWIDDPRALAWLAPQGAAGVQVRAWDEALQADDPGDVVVETFGCTLPEPFVVQMAQRPPAPVWLNLEYLSAEPYVERCHGLRSPQTGPGAGLAKWFFYPGFTAATGGLLQGLDGLDSASARAWVARQGWAPAPGEQSVLLFGYDSPAVAGLLAALAAEAQPTLLWLAAGALQTRWATTALATGQRAIALPWLAQPDFDRLIAAADLKLVRGEDSFVRAQLLGDGPLLWQIYPQDDGAHAAKLDAWLQRHLQGAPAGLATAVRQAQAAVNGLGAWPARLPDRPDWCAQHRHWQAGLRAQDDLATQLLRFVGRVST